MIVSKRRTMLPPDAMTKRLPNCLLTELKTGETAPGKFTPVFVSPRPLLLTRLTAPYFQRMAISAAELLRVYIRGWARLDWASVGTGI